jgi:FhuF 2Fe-2S C-terminal domain
MSDDLAGLGPFFAVSRHPPRAAPSPPWRPFSELTARPGPMLARIGAVRAALGRQAGRDASEIEPRVAASVAHLGLVARLIAPALAAAVLEHPLDMRAGGLWWQDILGGPVPLSVPEAGGRPGYLLDELIAPLTASTARAVPLSERVLWGNVASAVNSAASQVAALRPDLSERAWALARDVSASPLLARERRAPGPAFRRSSCCLFYRLAPQARAYCGDCVLTPRDPGN